MGRSEISAGKNSLLLTEYSKPLCLTKKQRSLQSAETILHLPLANGATRYSGEERLSTAVNLKCALSSRKISLIRLLKGNSVCMQLMLRYIQTPVDLRPVLKSGKAKKL